MNKFEVIQEKIANREDFVFLGKLGEYNVKTIASNNPNTIVMGGNGLLDGRLCMHVYKKLLLVSERQPKENHLLLIDGFAGVKNSGALNALIKDRKISSYELPDNVVFGLYDSNYLYDITDEIIDDASAVFAGFNQLEK